jgi:hypothetical protein
MIDGENASASQLPKTDLHHCYRRLRFRHLQRGKNVAPENNACARFACLVVIYEVWWA